MLYAILYKKHAKNVLFSCLSGCEGYPKGEGEGMQRTSMRSKKTKGAALFGVLHLMCVSENRAGTIRDE